MPFKFVKPFFLFSVHYFSKCGKHGKIISNACIRIEYIYLFITFYVPTIDHSDQDTDHTHKGHDTEDHHDHKHDTEDHRDHDHDTKDHDTEHYCSALEAAPMNSMMTCQNTNVFFKEVGSTCSFACIEGWKLVGEPVLTCVDDDTSLTAVWDYDPPVCKGLLP